VNRSRLVLFLLLFLPLSLRGERVVTLGAPVTEIVFALGAGDSVVAVDQSSTHPEAAAALRRWATCAWYRRRHPECRAGAHPRGGHPGPAAAVEQLKSSASRSCSSPTRTTPPTLREAILLLGRELGREKPAQALVESIEADLAQARARWAGRERPRVVFLMGNSGSAMAAGAGTQADGIITLAAAENLFAGTRATSLFPKRHFWATHRTSCSSAPSARHPRPIPAMSCEAWDSSISRNRGH
jgi:ABC-type hemin transport system substrate-binding protein